MGVAQHHDAVSGTSKQHVANDYAKRLYIGKTFSTFNILMVVVVLPDPFREIGTRSNSSDTQQLSHVPRSGQEIKDERSTAKDDAPERLRCGTIQKEASWILQL